MANTTLFRSLIGALIPSADAKNHEGAPAYALPPQHALAQCAVTGCLNTTFYATAETQLIACSVCASGSRRSSPPRRPCTAANGDT